MVCRIGNIQHCLREGHIIQLVHQVEHPQLSSAMFQQQPQAQAAQAQGNVFSEQTRRKYFPQLKPYFPNNQGQGQGQPQGQAQGQNQTQGQQQQQQPQNMPPGLQQGMPHPVVENNQLPGQMPGMGQGPTAGPGSVPGPGPTPAGITHALDDPNVYHWICQLTYGPSKEQALLELGKKREQYEDLAIVLWSSFGVMTSLLKEIISIYPLLSPPALSNQLSNRVCNALVLLQCVASHPDIRPQFLQAHIPLFLFPFLSTASNQRTFEYLRLTSLGVIGALVKNDSAEVISFLLRTDIIPLCLRIMENSSELSKIVAIFILQKILLDDNGLQFVCATPERFYAVSQVLATMFKHMSQQQVPGRLLKHVVRCYLRLSDNLEARRLLKQVLPQQLRDNTFNEALQDDVGTKRCLAQLLLTLDEQQQ